MIESPASELFSLPARSDQRDPSTAARIWRTICAGCSQTLSGRPGQAVSRADQPAWRTDLSAQLKRDLMRIEVRRQL